MTTNEGRYVEIYTSLIAERYGLNLKAEELEDGTCVISAGPVGHDTTPLKTLSANAALDFLDGFVSGVVVYSKSVMTDVKTIMESLGVAPMEQSQQSPPDLSPAMLEKIEHFTRCPDCLSTTTEPVLVGDGVWSMQIEHSPTCPALNSWIREHQGDDDE